VKIAVFPSAFHPSIGGVEELTRRLALEYRAAGHDVIVITNRWPRDLPARDDVTGLPVHRLPFRFPAGSRKAFLTYHASTWLVTLQLLALLRRERVDVLHVQCISSNARYALRAARLLRLPLVVTTQGELTMDANRIFDRFPQAASLFRQVMQQADVFTGCSTVTLRDALDRFGGRSGPALAIPNGVDYPAFHGADAIEHPRPYALAIGRFAAEKGFDLLLEAWAQVRPGVELLLAGDGPLAADLRARASALGLDDRVRFFGPANRSQVPSLFAGAEYVVLPSRADEGLPLVSVEAMAAGKALVCTRTGGIEDAVIDGETALVVPKGDVPALAAAIARVDGDPALRRRLGEAGGRRAVEFDWTALAGRYLAAFDQARAVHAAGR
jgi:glycogen(starch) synthase